MLVDYINDLHVDSHHLKYGARVIAEDLVRDQKSRVLLIPGDVGTRLESIKEFLDAIEPFYERIFLVPGNHDLYRAGRYADDIEKRISNFRRIMGTNTVRILAGDYEEFMGVTFFGEPVLYGPRYYKEDWGEKEKKLWVDNGFKILWDYKNFKADHMIDYHEAAVKRVADALKKADVVMTHTMPLKGDEYVEPQFVGNPANCCFQFDGLSLVDEDHVTKHWFYGHVHNRRNFSKSGIEFHTNALGYQGELQIEGARLLSIEV